MFVLMTLLFYWLQALRVDLTGSVWTGPNRLLQRVDRKWAHCWLSSDYAPTASVIFLLLPPIGSG
ncbi:hypothetical protein, partial [Mesorhizobium sp. M7A.F.Ca.US.007.01.1.1]|uniref:hypothetical protein n=1 Tax=Mesorhizobium sp. M7A.F.Ca.US.007.01.1.1 TaxID=2496712 RepID=UPI0019D21C04